MTHTQQRPPSRHRRLPLASALAASLSLTLSLAACSSGQTDGGDATAHDTLSVIATTTQLADFAREVGGSDVTVSSLLPAGGSAHHFDPSPRDLLALGTADVLIVNGAGLEGFIDSAVDASGFSGEIVTAADGIDLEAAAEATAAEADDHAGHDHANDHDHADHDHADHDHAHADDSGDHAGHDHGPVNPHLWTSPSYAALMAAEVARGLSAADPAHAAAYAERAAAYGERLEALDAWVHEQFDRVPRAERVLVSGHDSLSYFLHDYDITFVGAIMPSFEDNAEPSAAEIDALVAAIQTHGVPAIFVESSMSPKLAAAIARESGVRLVDADSLYADTLGIAGSGADTYIDATVHNTTLILQAWGYPVEEPPASVGAGA